MNKKTSYLNQLVKKSLALSLSALLVAYNLGINIQYFPQIAVSTYACDPAAEGPCDAGPAGP
jgi:hypothetical protein